MNVWKIATRWSTNGHPDSSILDIFRKYNILFAGKSQCTITNNVFPNDIIAISDGIKIVAIAKVLSKPKEITEYKFEKVDIERFDYEDWVIGFKVNIYDLNEEDYFDYRQGTFHRVREAYKERIIKLFEKYKLDYYNDSKFSIKARTCTLKYNLQNKEDIILQENIKYNIPIYQRPYSWTDEQIQKFISDIFRSYNGEKGSEPMFIGTMQLSERKYISKNKFEQDIIDGQQRLTTLLVLIKLLKEQFSNTNELNKINLNFIETRVNNGEQNKFLQDFINSDLTYITEETQNPYILNGLIIKQILNSEFTNEDNSIIEFDLDNFIKFLFSKIYFVVIETKAGLSKTLQIFDAINTTGLDLNGGDIFKIRMYEYLRDKRNYSECAFDEISELYARIDRNNREKNLSISIEEILDIYKYIIISKNNLPNVLYTYATTTFFERLFDVIFDINRWENFVKANEVNLSLLDIEKIIEIRFKWETINYPTLEDACSMNFIWWSRYSRYWILVFIFMFRFNSERDYSRELFLFIRQLSKLYIIYSIKFQKAVNEIHSFTYSLINQINTKNIDEIITFINKKIGTIDDQNQGYYSLNSFITDNLIENRKRKDIVCRLSAMLEENYKNSKKINDITEKLFDNYKFPIDIEHIQSFNDENVEKREEIQLEWGDDLNSLGNLMVLESTINRSIGNESYKEKVKRYEKSEYKIVRNQVKKNPNSWNLQKAKIRKEVELDKILHYLFDK
ncbi:MAG: DUF262 domain-containing protein [Pleomorphochaeta sp.]